MDNSQGVFLDNYYYYDTIDNHQTKIMLPKNNQKGQMVIYMNKVDKKGNHFSIYSTKPLLGKDSLDLLKVFKTIKINW